MIDIYCKSTYRDKLGFECIPVADLGFQIGEVGAPTLRGERAPTHNFAKFCPKKCMKLKESGRLTGADPGFGQEGGAQLLRTKVADVLKQSCVRGASH